MHRFLINSKENFIRYISFIFGGEGAYDKWQRLTNQRLPVVNYQVLSTCEGLISKESSPTIVLEATSITSTPADRNAAKKRPSLNFECK